MKKAQKNEIKILDKHDYLSIVSPNSRFTISWSGFKSSGLLTKYDESFKALVAFCEDKSNKTMGEKAKDLQNGMFVKLFPQCFDEIKLAQVGDKIRFSGGFSKHYPGVYEVIESRKTTFCIMLNGRVSNFQQIEAQIV